MTDEDKGLRTASASPRFKRGDRVRMPIARAREVKNDHSLTGTVVGVSVDGLTIHVLDTEGDTCDWAPESLVRDSASPQPCRVCGHENGEHGRLCPERKVGTAKYPGPDDEQVSSNASPQATETEWDQVKCLLDLDFLHGARDVLEEIRSLLQANVGLRQQLDVTRTQVEAARVTGSPQHVHGTDCDACNRRVADAFEKGLAAARCARPDQTSDGNGATLSGVAKTGLGHPIAVTCDTAPASAFGDAGILSPKLAERGRDITPDSVVTVETGPNASLARNEEERIEERWADGAGRSSSLARDAARAELEKLRVLALAVGQLIQAQDNAIRPPDLMIRPDIAWRDVRRAFKDLVGPTEGCEAADQFTPAVPKEKP